MLKLAISVDVEEEGLFSGRYPRRGGGLENVQALRRLDFIPEAYGFPLTLLTTYPVAVSRRCRPILLRCAEKQGAEIGAHLHPWNTPPFMEPPGREPLPAADIPPALLTAKLETLLKAIRNGLGVDPGAFRMGRFDLCRQLLDLMPAHGLTVDSSIVPLRYTSGGTDHFPFPADPFAFTGLAGAGTLTEAPLTVVAWSPPLARLVYGLARFLGPAGKSRLLTAFRYVAAVGTQPTWFPLASMLSAARLHLHRGGRVMTMLLHSSELMPGATPMFPDEHSVSRLIEKLRRFLDRLTERSAVQGVTLSQLAGIDTGQAAIPAAALKS